MKTFLPLLFLICFLPKMIFAQLNGEYTINPELPASTNNYQDFSNAVSDLMYGVRNDGIAPNGIGVSDTVIFNIANGFYNETINIGKIFGASDTTIVIFQSESGNNSDVVIHGENLNAQNSAVIILDNANYLQIKDLTIEADSGEYARAVYFKNNSSYITFSGNHIKGIDIKTIDNTNYLYAVIYFDINSESYNHNIFENNIIEEGSCGIYINNGSGNIFENNQFIKQYYRSLYVNRNHYPLITGNHFYNPDNEENVYAIFLHYCLDSMKVINNIIEGDYHLAIYNYGSNRSTYYGYALIANNFINVKKHGILNKYARYAKYYHNNVKVTINNSYAFYATSTSQNDSKYLYLKNNNLIAEDGYGIYYHQYHVYGFYSDNNNIYAEITGRYTISGSNHVNKTTLADWQSAVNKDLNSISEDPMFHSSSDLHTYNSNLIGGGDSIAALSVLYDIDGDARPDFPCIGADEFVMPDIYGDAGIVSVDSLINFVPVLVNDSLDVYVTLINQGVDTLFSTTVNWSVNETAQTQFNWNDTLLVDSTISIKIGAYKFLAQGSGYNFKVYTSEPNGGVDIYAANDTVNYDFYTALDGNYTIGGAESDFETFSNAVEIMNNYGISNNVVFNIRDGVYNERVVINEIQGTDETKTITFQSESGDSSLVVLQYGISNNPVFCLDGADFVTIKQLSIIQTSSGQAITIKNGANNNEVLNCFLQGYQTTSESEKYAVIYSPSSVDALDINNVFKNNYILYGNLGIFYYGDNTSYIEPGTIIENNILKDQTFRAIQLRYQDAPVISSNTIQTDVGKTNNLGIYALNCDNGLRIVNNNVKARYMGIDVNACDGTSDNYGLVAGNIVYVEGSHTTNFGIYLGNSNYQWTINNTSVNNGASGKTNYAYCLAGTSLNIKLKNNILIAPNGYGIYFDYYNGSRIALSDYNNIVAETTGRRRTGSSSYVSYSTLNDWQTYGFDSHSFSENVNFISETDLHLTEYNKILDRTGDTVTYAELSYDIDGDVRNMEHPDIGGDEFIAPEGIDAAITSIYTTESAPYLAGDYNIYTTIKNLCIDTLFNADVCWTVNGVIQTTYNFEGALEITRDSIINLGTINFEASQVYDIKVWSSMPNGANDCLNNNDTLQLTLHGALEGGTYTIGGTEPDFENFTELADYFNFGGVYESDTFNFLVRDGIYNEQFIIDSIPGANSNSLFTFSSESQDSSLVILTYASNSSDSNYVMLLNEIGNIEFNQITFKATGNYQRVVYMYDTYGIKFNNCVFEGQKYTAETDYELILANFDSDLNNWEFNNNLFIGGNYGIIYYGDEIFNNKGLIINNNVFQENISGLHISNIDSLTIETNQINSLENGIYIDNCLYSEIISNEISGVDNGIIIETSDTYNILNNNVNSKILGIDISNVNSEFNIRNNRILTSGNEIDEVYGIRFNNTLCTLENNGIVANNFITMQGGSETSGIKVENSSYIAFYYNNVNISNSNEISKAINLMSSCNNTTLINNIFANYSNAYALFSDVIVSDLVDTSDYNSFYSSGDFICNINGYNINTIENYRIVCPGIDSNSLQTNPYYTSITNLTPNNSLLNNTGCPVALITDDINGYERDAANPDIGAIIFSVRNIDAGIIEIFTDSDLLCNGNYNFYAIISNFGTEILTSDIVKWSVNDMLKTTINWNGELQTNETDTVFLGTHDITSEQLLTLKAWTTFPNNNTDENTSNDLFEKDFEKGISGEYSIGKSSNNDFNSFTEAVNFLTNSLRICSAVVFNVEEGTYNESFEITELTGASSENTITFRSVSEKNNSVIITTDEYAEYLVSLNGADNIIFDNIRFEIYDNSDYGILFKNGACNNTITNCKFIAPPEYGYCIHSEYNSNNENDDYNIISNNAFENGDYAIYWEGNNDMDKYDNGIEITGNIFTGQYSIGIEAYNIDGIKINNNQITNNSNSDDYYNAIYFYTDNYINNSFEISNNLIDLYNGERAIYANAYYDKKGISSIISNNSISFTSSYSWFTGIYTSYSNNLHVLNNSVNLYGEASNSKCFYTESCYSLVVLNNIFSNNSGGYSIYGYGGSKSYQSDYNILNTTGSYLARWNGTYIADLTTLQSHSSQDYNSLSIDPVFYFDNDLRTCNYLLDGTALPTDYVTTDVNGNLRDVNNPDIGAYEFISVENFDLGEDISICGNDIFILDAGQTDGTYLWSTGDTTRTIPVTIAGTYSVQINSNCGIVSDTITITDNTSSAHAEFNYSYNDFKISFTNQSTDASSYYWDFDDGNTSYDINPVHVYDSTGTYNVSLIAYHECNNDTIFEQIEVCQNTIAGYTYATHGGELTFTNTSHFAVSYIWYFGDGQTSEDKNPTYTYTENGMYSVSLVAYNICSTDSVTMNINVVACEAVNAAFTYSNDYDEITFENQSVYATDYLWDFGDGQTSEDENPIHIYTENGMYSVLLVAYNICSTDSVTMNINVVTCETVNASFTYSNNNGEVTFENLSVGATNYLWNFDDGQTSESENPIHIYSENGTYTVTLTVNNECNSNEMSIDIHVVVCEEVNAAFTYSNDNGEVTFENLSVGATNYLWNFGDGQTSEDENPTNIYSENGTYTVKLFALNSCESNSIEMDITVIVCESVNAIYSFSISNKTVSFSNYSTGAIDIKWDFGDGQTSEELNPVHTYDNEGTYPVQLIASNDCNSDTLLINVPVYLTDISDIESVETINVFPNPSNGFFNVELSLSKYSDITILIFDVVGNKLIIKEFENVKYLRENIDISNYPAGIYYLKVMSGNNQKVKRIVKQ
ncbi:MAG: PKD domain-containing protein [Bacteroidales bacterium]|nr:PKD domain-containing protein [Bacteroidales bacterium]